MITARLSIGGAAALASLLLVAPAAWALDPDKRLSDCTVRSWGPHEGLPGGWVRTLVQTADGYLWIGTQGGLVRYGGGELQLVPVDRGQEPAGDVLAIAPASDGTLWVGPPQGPPTCLRGLDPVPCFSPGNVPAPASRILAMQPEPGGAVLLATATGIYRAGRGGLAPVHPASRWGSAPINALAAQGNRLWIATGAGLFMAEGSKPPAAAEAGFRGQPVTALFAAPAGHLWVAGERRLVRLDGPTALVIGTAQGLPPVGRVTAMLEDRDGSVWLATRAGLLRYHPGRGFTSFSRADGLPDDDISALLEDREGSLWVGTRGAGLAQFSDRTLGTAHSPPSLRERWINTVAEGPDGTLWAGSYLGLTRWKDGEERSYRQADGLPHDQVLVVWPAPDGTVWVGTERGLRRWRDGTIERPLPIDTEVTALYLDGQGTLWIGGHDRLSRFDRNGLTELGGPHNIPDVPLGEVRGMQHDDQGVLWISAGGRLLRLEGNRLRRDRTPGEPVFGRIRALHRDAEGTLWLGTRDGLVRRRDGRWRAFGPGPRFEAGDLFQVLSDDQGNLWAGSARGLLQIDKAALERGQGFDGFHVRSFETSDQRREVGVTRPRQPGAWRGADGRLWFASSRGVVQIDPARVRMNRLPPPVRIERVLVDGRATPLDQPQRFPPGSGALEFHYAVVTLIEPHKAHHRYRLEGFDADWVNAGTRRAAYYTNISPGRYRFQVQGRNADGVWNLEGASVELTLAPHFRQTPWYYGLWVVAALALVLAFYRMRVAQLHGRWAAIASERNRVARELHDNLLQGMSGALIQLKALRKRFAPHGDAASPGEIADEIQEIEQVLAENVEETRRSIWELREQPGPQAGLGPALEQLARRLARPGVDVQLSVAQPTSPVPAAAGRELVRIAQEALVNAIEHGQARRVELRLEQPDGGLRLVIQDDGRGFEPAQAPGAAEGHFGLTGMRERASALGDFNIHSRPGGGTRIEVNVRPQLLHEAAER